MRCFYYPIKSSVPTMDFILKTIIYISKTFFHAFINHICKVIQILSRFQSYDFINIQVVNPNYEMIRFIMCDYLL